LGEALAELRDFDGSDDAASLIDYLDEYKTKVVISGGGFLWRPAELLVRASKNEGSVEWQGSVEWRTLPMRSEVNREHVQTLVSELAEEVDVSSHRCTELLGCFARVPPQELANAMSPWVDAHFRDAADAERRLSTLVDYCEGQGCYAAGCCSNASDSTTNKLRMVVQLIHVYQDEEKLPILLLLAAHGGVCNVQKEIGIDSAYAQLTRTCAEHAHRSSFPVYVLRVLRQKREQLVEAVFVEDCVRKHIAANSHYLAPFRNFLADQVGVPKLSDPNAAPIEENGVQECIARFWQLYSLDQVVAEVAAALNHSPRRIPYDTLVSWLEANVPQGCDTYAFLSASFDMHGNVRAETIQHSLWCLGVLRSPATLAQGDLAMQIGGQEWCGVDAYVALAKRCGQQQTL
jgi:hypothetical protein